MCSYLVYPSFPLIGVVGAVSLVISLPGASESKVQMVVPHGVVRAMVLVTQEVTGYSQRLLKLLGVDPGGYLGLLPRRFGPAPMKVAGMGLLLWRSLAGACFQGGPWAGPGPTEVSASGLLPQRSLLCTCSCGGCCLRPALVKVTGSGLLLQRLLARACSHDVPGPGLLL